MDHSRQPPKAAAGDLRIATRALMLGVIATVGCLERQPMPQPSAAAGTPPPAFSLSAATVRQTATPAALTPAAPPRPALPPVRNVLFLVIDTLRADHLSCYGYPRRTSPTIDALASRSIRFERCSTAWPETCQSMCAMLTGTWPQTSGVVLKTPASAPLEIEFVAEALDAAGIATAAIVTNSVLTTGNRFGQGCDQYLEIWNREHNPRNRREIDLAIEWLRAHRDERFWLWVHLIEPHAPYSPRDADRFVGDAFYDPTVRVEVRPPERKFDSFGGFPGFSRIEGHDELAYYVAQYDSEIVDTDRKIEILLEGLGQLGLADDTAIVLVADHGEGFGEHRYFWHGLVPFEETANVPLIVHVPGVAPAIVQGAVSTIDLAPTMLELLGRPPSPQHEGVSLVPQMIDPSLGGDRVIFVESGHDGRNRNWQRSARDRRFKLVHVPSPREQDQLSLEAYQLYDLEKDPGETTDVSALHPEVVVRLTAELHGWMRDEALFLKDETPLTPAELDRIRQEGYAVGSDGEDDEDESRR